MTISLDVTARTASARAERAAGRVPGVVYGPKQEPISITTDAFTFTKTLREAGESTILTLKGLDEEIEVLVHDVAFDAEKGGVSHVDFYAIERGKELTVNVAIEFTGESAAEKSGAMINKALHEIEVTCRPSVLPSQIEVSLESLASVGDQITVADLVVPEGVAFNTEAETLVAAAAEARAEEVDEPVESVDMDAVEVKEKGKAEEAESEG